VAASAPADLLPDGWHFTLPSARSFAISASDQYNVSASYSNGVQILSYAFPEDFTTGEVPRNAAGDALALYEDLYGKYPHKSLSVVEADFPDGMEYDGLFFLGKSYYKQYRGNPYSYLVAIAAHETAHQWFYGQIGNDPALEPWLDESLATYSELLFYERYYPDTSENWWNFRVEHYSPRGNVDGTIYDFGDFRPYVNAVYLRGAEFLRDLRAAIGEEAFLAFLKDYSAKGKTKSPGSVVTAADFFSILSENSTADLSDLIAEYFQHFSP
jgi:aminopeptidase N